MIVREGRAPWLSAQERDRQTDRQPFSFSEAADEGHKYLFSVCGSVGLKKHIFSFLKRGNYTGNTAYVC